MGDNPFQKTNPPADDEGKPAVESRDKTVEAALDAADAADDAAEAASEAVSELFPDATQATEEDSADVEADPEEGLFDDAPATLKIPKGWTEATYRRFRKVIGQRNQSRKDNEELRTVVASNSELVRVFSDKYAGHANPAAIARYDADFMDAVEKMAKTNMGIAQLADQVKAFQQTGAMPVSDNQPIARAAAADATPQTDPQVAKLIEQGARNTINTSLESLNVKPAFQKIIADSLVTSGADLASLDHTAVVAAAKSFVRDNGFTAAEVLSTATPKAKSKPPTGKQGQAATSNKSRGSAQDDDKPDAPKTREEWLANRDRALSEMIEASE